MSGARVSSGMLTVDSLFQQIVYVPVSEGMSFNEVIEELAKGINVKLYDLNPDQSIDRLITGLQQARCLIVLDNVENILEGGITLDRL